MKHLDGSVLCNKCRTDMVVIDRTYVCECDIRKLSNWAPDEANRLRRVVDLVHGRSTLCDRCGADAWRLVQCADGCSHAQCDDCADQTREEAREAREYARQHPVVDIDRVDEVYADTYETLGDEYIDGDTW